MLDSRLITAWELAADDLGFRFITPFQTADRDGRTLLLEGHLPDFGGQHGIAIISFSRRIKLGTINMPVSIMPKEARKYVRKHVISELRDWGWFGPGSPPIWMNGN